MILNIYDVSVEYTNGFLLAGKFINFGFAKKLM